jgi:hypothetical protein
VRQHEPKCRLFVTQTKADLLGEPAVADAAIDDQSGTSGVLEKL